MDETCGNSPFAREIPHSARLNDRMQELMWGPVAGTKVADFPCDDGVAWKA
jgi:hypothetical protein